jgi:hypothetical protein
MATLNSSNITDGNTVEPNDLLQLYDAFTSGGGTTGAYSVSISGSLTGSASTATSSSYALSASFATTASFALNASSTVTQINDQGYSNQGGSFTSSNFKFYAGTARIISNLGTTSNFPGLAGKTLGTNVWVTATIQGSASSFASDIVTIRELSVDGALIFETNSVPDNTTVHFHVIYIPG